MLYRTASYTVAAVFAALMLTTAPMFAQTPGAQAKPAQKPAVDIMWMSKPPKTGENTFQVMVKDASGKPITDADVTAQFYMAAMPQMKMPEMKNTIALKHQKDGTYSGTGQVMMAGKWDVTVSVKRAGKQIASKKFAVTAH